MLLSCLLGLPVVGVPPLGKTSADASVVLVQTSLGDGPRGKQGSGVVVAPGVVATNAHVLQGGHDPRVLKDGASWPVARLRVDPAHDLCLLTIPDLPLPPAVAALGAPQVGQAIFSVGYPEGQGPVWTQGRLLGDWHFGQSSLLQSDAPIQHGSSGGGLFDDQGRLLGLTTFTFSENSRLTFSVPIQWVQDLAAKEPGPAMGPGHPEDLTTSDILNQLAQDDRNWPAWEQCARAWSTANPEDPDAWMALGLALDKLSHRLTNSGTKDPAPLMAEAVQCFERSVSLRASSLRPQAEGWTALAVALDTLNRFKEAERAFRMAVRLDPTMGQAWLGLGATLLNDRRPREAAEAYSKGLALEPDNGQAWARYAYALQKGGHLEEAYRAYPIALRYRPLSDELWWEVGVLHWQLGQKKEAEAILVQLKAKDSPFAPKLQALLKRPKPSRIRPH